VNRVEIYPVPPEYRDAYERAYFLVRVPCEVGTVFVPPGLPAKADKSVRYLDVGQSVVLVGRGVFDLPEVTRSGGGPLRLDWSDGMLQHSPTWTNSTDLAGGLLGLGGDRVVLRPRPGGRVRGGPGFPGHDPTKPPPGFEWRGRPGSTPGSREGSYYNPSTSETLHLDLSHPSPIGPHWDYRDPNGRWWRIYPDGRMEPKG
jgi:hypothetical protein